MCIPKKEQKYTVVAEIFVAIKVTVLEIKIEGIQFSSLKSNIMKYIYPVIIKKKFKDLILLINIFQDGYEIEFLNKYFCFKQYTLQNKQPLSDLT